VAALDPAACSNHGHPARPSTLKLRRRALRSCRIKDGDVGRVGRFRYGLPGLTKQNEVLGHRFAHELLGLGTRVSRRNDTRQIW
jgi:hypothetical protein